MTLNFRRCKMTFYIVCLIVFTIVWCVAYSVFYDKIREAKMFFYIVRFIVFAIVWYATYSVFFDKK